MDEYKRAEARIQAIGDQYEAMFRDSSITNKAGMIMTGLEILDEYNAKFEGCESRGEKLDMAEVLKSTAIFFFIKRCMDDIFEAAKS